MKASIIILFLINFHLIFSQNQYSDSIIKISDFIILQNEKTSLYRSFYKNNLTNKVSDRLDTIMQKRCPSNMNAFFFWKKNLPLHEPYMNYFIEGILLNQNDSIYYSPVRSKNDLIKNLELTLLFPKEVELYKHYECRGAFDEKITYYINSCDTLTSGANNYGNGIRITKIRYGEYRNEIDFIWLVKGVGVVKWEMSTGRCAILLNTSIKRDFQIAPDFAVKEYKNKEGITQSINTVKALSLNNGTFSKAKYNSKGLLIEEIFLGQSGELHIDSVKYLHDEDKKLIEEYLYSEKQLIGRKTFKYEQNGNLKSYKLIIYEDTKIRKKIRKKLRKPNIDLRYSKIHSLHIKSK